MSNESAQNDCGVKEEYESYTKKVLEYVHACLYEDNAKKDSNENSKKDSNENSKRLSQKSTRKSVHKQIEDIFEEHKEKLNKFHISRSFLKNCALGVIEKICIEDFQSFSTYDIFEREFQELIKSRLTNRYVYATIFVLNAITKYYEETHSIFDEKQENFCSKYVDIIFPVYMTEKANYEAKVNEILNTYLYKEKILDKPVSEEEKIRIEGYLAQLKEDKLASIRKTTDKDIIKKLEKEIEELKRDETINELNKPIQVLIDDYDKKTEKVALWFCNNNINKSEEQSSDESEDENEDECKDLFEKGPVGIYIPSPLNELGVLDEIKKAYLEDYFFPKYTDYDSKIVKERLGRMKAVALYYMRLYYLTWNKYKIVKMYFADPDNVIEDKIIKFWHKRHCESKKEVGRYYEKTKDILIRMLNKSIQNMHKAATKKGQNTGTDDWPKTWELVDVLTSDTIPDPQKDLIIKENRQELWDIIKNLTNNINNKKLFTKYMYRDIIILDMLCPEESDEKIASRIKGANSNPYNSGDLQNHRRTAKENILKEYFRVPSRLKRIREKIENFTFKEFLKSQSEEEQKKRSKLFGVLKDILEGLKDLYDQESEDFKKYFKVRYNLCRKQFE